jgi:hypothetical protein
VQHRLVVLTKRLALFAVQALSSEKADETKAGINQVMATYEHQRPVYISFLYRTDIDSEITGFRFSS